MKSNHIEYLDMSLSRLIRKHRSTSNIRNSTAAFLKTFHFDVRNVTEARLFLTHCYTLNQLDERYRQYYDSLAGPQLTVEHLLAKTSFTVSE